MNLRPRVHLPILLLIMLFGSSCDFFFGKKQDSQTTDVFRQGAIDPGIPSTVGYVPILPVWKNIPSPVDVYVGYDNMVYVCDANGLDIFDLKGSLQRNIPIDGASDVCQDRELRTYVAGRVNRMVNGTLRNLAAVYVIANAAAAGNPLITDTLIHPFCDQSRNNTSFRGAPDEQVQFTGITSFADNSIALARTGPTNDPAGISRPDNAILFYNSHHQNTHFANGLSPAISSLKSVMGLSSIASFAAPPQSVSGVSTSQDLLLTQDDPAAAYKVLWVKMVNDPDLGIIYTENSSLLSFDFSHSTRFLYQANRFSHPSRVCVATDNTGYIFVADAGRDSVYQFTPKGYEGVNPPANSATPMQVLASFGGSGSGPFNFLEPSGLCYYNKTLFVADKGNNRICRYKLSTDVE